jgi:tetratricopeptide (TPR) repeat protein/4-amino-4-deoxy-L-arabinose transferase-like glycosyltransferase
MESKFSMIPFIKKHLAAILFLIVFFALGIPALNQMLMYTPDCARYLAWSNALAQWKGFLDIASAEPTRYVIHAPLYPLLLVPAAWIAPMSIVGAKVTTLLLSLVALWLFYRWVERTTENRWTAWIAMAMLAFHPLFLLYSTQVLSEIPFIICLITFFLLADDVEKSTSRHWKEYIFITIIVAGIFLREVGLSLMLAATVLFVWKKQYQRALLIFLVAVLAYLLWFVRNEVIVAGAENPPLKNSAIFLNHIYTSNNTSFLIELWERLQSNVRVYWNYFVQLVFMPDIRNNSIGVIDLSHSMIIIGQRIASILQYPLFILSIGLCGYGARVLQQKTKDAVLILIFLCVYLLPILFYPINDVRFLFPLLILLLYTGAVGAAALVQHSSQKMSRSLLIASLSVTLLIVFLPNLFWDIDYLYNSWQDTYNTESFAQNIPQQTESPEAYSRPVQLAGLWIAQHSAPNTTVMGLQKELFLWTGEKTIVETDPHLMPDDFDHLIRDYHPQYLVTNVAPSGMREFEPLICFSRRYMFETVSRFGNIEILRIHPKEDSVVQSSQKQIITTTDTLRALFRHGLSFQVEPTAAKADTIFQVLARRTHGVGLVALELGTAKELLGNYKAANYVFDGFRSVSQAGAYLRQAWYHKETIAKRQRAATASNPEMRANLYNILGVNYRELGYIGESYYLMQQSFKADSTFYPTLIFSAIYSYQDGDIQRARYYCSKAAQADSQNILTVKLKSILGLENELQHTAILAERTTIQMRIAGALIDMGMREDAIDVFIKLLKADPDNIDARVALGELYIVKERWSPARKAFIAILQHDPNNQKAKTQLKFLDAR